jgi:double-stranded uracil-DNA glycosylase
VSSERKRSFAPVVDAGTRILVLGSLPGEVSLRRAQYYAHPRNQFWRLMEPVIDARLIDRPYEARLAALLSAGVGLWDVIGSARRAGSLDTDIRDSRANALPELVARLPSLRGVAFNGAKASELGRRQLGKSERLTLISLPSSSPAYTAAFDKKMLEWRRIGSFLGDPPRA